MLRMRKELIQSRSKVNDMQDELEEKTTLYLKAIKVCTHFLPISRLHVLFCAIIKPQNDII